jgi:hypothetical protein
MDDDEDSGTVGWAAALSTWAVEHERCLRPALNLDRSTIKESLRLCLATTIVDYNPKIGSGLST